MPSKTKNNETEDQMNTNTDAAAEQVADVPAEPAVPVDTLPEELLEALAGYEGIQGADSWMSQSNKRSIDLRRIEIVQVNAKNHPIMYGGRQTAGRIALTRGKAGELEVEYVDAMRLILIDALLYDQYKMPQHLQTDPRVAEVVRRDRGIGERMMWKHDDGGKRQVVEGEKPLCTSNNGLNPYFLNIGQDIPDPRFPTINGQQVFHRIGFAFDPEFGYVPVENACLSCPFASWVSEKESADGKRKKPMCQPTFRYVVWDIDREELFTIKGSNGTVHNALLGANTGTFGSKYDGSAVSGIVKPFALAGMLNKHTGERLDIQAFIKRKTSIPGDQIVEWAADWIGFYNNRPDGVPTLERPEAVVYPVMLTTALSMKNTFGSQPVIPIFTVLDGAVQVVDGVFHTAESPNWIKAAPHPLDAHEVAAYLRVLAEYTADNWRDVLMGLSVRPDDASQLLSAPSNSAQAALPAGSSHSIMQPAAAAPNMVQLPAPDDIDVNDPFA